MIINVTGVDGAGKSTLTTALQKQLGWNRAHFTQPRDMADGRQQYFNFLANTRKDVITDRLHEGEWIYAPLYRGYTPTYLQEFELALVKNHNYLMVHVTASPQEILRRTRGRGEDFVPEHDFAKIRLGFETFLQQQTLPWVEVDTSSTSSTSIENHVARIITAQATVGKIWQQVRGCIHRDCCTQIFDPALPSGNLQPTYFVIGQNPGGRDKRPHSTAFNDGPTSQFLREVMIEAGVLRESWLTNSMLCPSVDNKVSRAGVQRCDHHLRLQLELLQPKVVVILGRSTAEFIDPWVSANFSIVELLHPTYVRRFLSKQRDEYVDTWKKIERVFNCDQRT